MADNEKQGILQSMISCISFNFWSNELKVEGFLNYYSELQPEKLSRA